MTSVGLMTTVADKTFLQEGTHSPAARLWLDASMQLADRCFGADLGHVLPGAAPVPQTLCLSFLLLH